MSEGRAKDRGERLATSPSGPKICFREFGNQADPALLLIAGLGEDLDAWGEDFVQAIVASGFRVITMDNRDAGRSGFVTATPRYCGANCWRGRGRTPMGWPRWPPMPSASLTTWPSTGRIWSADPWAA